jgi:hypothetical protein
MDALAVTKDKFNAALQRGSLIISGFRIEPVETSACPLLQGDCFYAPRSRKEGHATLG